MWTLAHPFCDPSNHQEPIHVGWVHMAWFCTIRRCGTSIGLSSFDLKCWKGGRADVTQASVWKDIHVEVTHECCRLEGGWVDPLLCQFWLKDRPPILTPTLHFPGQNWVGQKMWTLAHPFCDPSNHQEPIHVGWVHMAWFCTIRRCGTSIGLSSFDLKCWKGGRADVTQASVTIQSVLKDSCGHGHDERDAWLNLTCNLSAAQKSAGFQLRTTGHRAFNFMVSPGGLEV